MLVSDRVFFAAKEERYKLAIRDRVANYYSFYNGVMTELFLTGNKTQEDIELEFCLKLLKRIAFVEIQVSEMDPLHIERQLPKTGYESLAAIGTIQ